MLDLVSCRWRMRSAANQTTFSRVGSILIGSTYTLRHNIVMGVGEEIFAILF
jgi:hypothetical protein